MSNLPWVSTARLRAASNNPAQLADRTYAFDACARNIGLCPHKQNHPLGGWMLILWHQFCCHTDEIRNGYGITFDAIGEKWLHFGATSSPAHKNGSDLEPKQKDFSRGLIFRPSRCLPSEGNKYFFERLNFRPFSWSTTWGENFFEITSLNWFPRREWVREELRQKPKKAPPIPRLMKIVPRQLNSRYRDRYDCAMNSKERAWRRRGDPGAGV